MLSTAAARACKNRFMFKKCLVFVMMFVFVLCFKKSNAMAKFDQNLLIDFAIGYAFRLFILYFALLSCLVFAEGIRWLQGLAIHVRARQRSPQPGSAPSPLNPGMTGPSDLCMLSLCLI